MKSQTYLTHYSCFFILLSAAQHVVAAANTPSSQVEVPKAKQEQQLTAAGPQATPSKKEAASSAPPAASEAAGSSQKISPQSLKSLLMGTAMAIGGTIHYSLYGESNPPAQDSSSPTAKGDAEAPPTAEKGLSIQISPPSSLEEEDTLPTHTRKTLSKISNTSSKASGTSRAEGVESTRNKLLDTKKAPNLPENMQTPSAPYLGYEASPSLLQPPFLQGALQNDFSEEQESSSAYGDDDVDSMHDMDLVKVKSKKRSLKFWKKNKKKQDKLALKKELKEKNVQKIQTPQGLLNTSAEEDVAEEVDKKVSRLKQFKKWKSDFKAKKEKDKAAKKKEKEKDKQVQDGIEAGYLFDQHYHEQLSDEEADVVLA